MTSYALGICELCEAPMTLLEIQEGVQWSIEERHWLCGYSWLGEDEEARVAHKRCWKELSEPERRHIRNRADAEPRSMGQMV